MDIFWAAPPVSRTLTALIFITSVCVYSGLLDSHRIVFYAPWIFKLPVPEIWRFFSPFLLTGPKLGMIFDTYFFWNYASGLEKDSSRFAQPGDFFTYIIFVGLVIVATSGGILGGLIFTHALILAVAYTYAQENKGKKVSFFIVTFNVIWLPWAILLMTLVMSGPDSALYQLPGAIAAHLYDFLTRLYPEFGGGRNWIQTPTFVKRWFGAERRGVQVKNYGTAFRPATQEIRPSNAWGSRGQGQRLGGD